MEPKEGQRRVLVALDGSACATNAFEWYFKNMMKPDDFVFGVMVPEYSLKGVTAVKLVGPLADAQALSDDFRKQYDVVEKMCADYTADLRRHRVAGKVDAYPGDKPAPTIASLIETLQADVVVMGTRGHTGIKKLFMGSVSQQVLSHACHLCVPVSVVPLKPETQQKS